MRRFRVHELSRLTQAELRRIQNSLLSRFGNDPNIIPVGFGAKRGQEYVRVVLATDVVRIASTILPTSVRVAGPLQPAQRATGGLAAEGSREIGSLERTIEVEADSTNPFPPGTSGAVWRMGSQIGALQVGANDGNFSIGYGQAVFHMLSEWAPRRLASIPLSVNTF